MGFDLDAIRHLSEQAETKSDHQHLPEAANDIIQQIDPRELVEFPKELHKFKPATESRMDELKKSIYQNGIINALIVRKLPSGEFQILTGHNRRVAAMELGYTTVPCVVKEQCSDDDAIRIMVDDNLNHRELLPSELGWAYRQLMDIRKHQGYTCGHSVHKSRDTITDEVGGRHVQRYIRLTYLISPLLNLVDARKISMRVGEQLSYLSTKSQEIVYGFCYVSEPPRPLKEAQAKMLREVEADSDRIIDVDLLEQLTEKQTNNRLRTLKIEMAKLREYFPTGTPEEVVVQTIQAALATYFRKNEQE